MSNSAQFNPDQVPTVDIRQFCVADGVTDDAANGKMLNAITLAASKNFELCVPAGVSVYLGSQVSYTLPVGQNLRISGKGQILHTAAGGLYILGTLTSLGSLSKTTQIINPQGTNACVASELQLANTLPASAVRGGIVLITCNDTLVDQPVNGTAIGLIGELQRIADVPVNAAGLPLLDLNNLLEFPYVACGNTNLIGNGALQTNIFWESGLVSTGANNTPGAAGAFLRVNSVSSYGAASTQIPNGTYVLGMTYLGSPVSVTVTGYIGGGSSGEWGLYSLSTTVDAQQGSLLPLTNSTIINGGISALGAIVGGSGYDGGGSGTFYNVALTGGTGSGATANITVASGVVTACSIIGWGKNYTVGDSLSATTIGAAGGSLFTVAVSTTAAVMYFADQPSGNVNVGQTVYVNGTSTGLTVTSYPNTASSSGGTITMTGNSGVLNLTGTQSGAAFAVGQIVYLNGIYTSLSITGGSGTNWNVYGQEAAPPSTSGTITAAAPTGGATNASSAYPTTYLLSGLITGNAATASYLGTEITCSNTPVVNLLPTSIVDIRDITFNDPNYLTEVGARGLVASWSIAGNPAVLTVSSITGSLNYGTGTPGDWIQGLPTNSQITGYTSGSTPGGAGTYSLSGLGLVNATALTEGSQYTIVVLGTTDFTTFGATSNTVGLTFTASASGTSSSGTGTVSYLLSGSVLNVTGGTSVLAHANGDPGLGIEGIAYPNITAKFTNQVNQACTLISCWEADVDTKVTNSANTQNNGSYGYGVIVGGSTAFSRIKVRGVCNRHTFTVSGARLAANSANYTQFGAQRHNTVYDSDSFGNLSTSFDLHSTSYYTRYENCRSFKQTGNIDYNPAEVTVNAFNDRGVGTQFVNCQDFGNSGLQTYGMGYNRLPPSGGGNFFTTRVINQIADMNPIIIEAVTGLTTQQPFSAQVSGMFRMEFLGGAYRGTNVTLANNIGLPQPTYYFDGCVFEDQSGGFVLGNYNTVVMKNCTRRRTGAPLGYINVGAHTTLTLDNYAYDGASFSSNTLVGVTGTGATVNIGKTVNLQNTPVYPAQLTNFVLDTSSYNPTVKRIAEQEPAVITQNTSYQLTDADYLVKANATLGAVVLTLPANPPANKQYEAIKMDSSTNLVSFSSTLQINGATTANLGLAQWSAMIVAYDAQIGSANVTAGNFVIGSAYTITAVGNTTWSAIGGSASPAIGQSFVATGAGSGTGTASPNPCWNIIG